ncbi:hypothetical protein EGW08_023207 [Elysia chlorotica]|uniref:Uncharacterized protein n=1 Tax=Elysia chlorotica TaxID=188477 RepID=A0A433SJ27_ELYCH|nr:hypothetical protein EGW08_023207 [Elysia chlorotica]
MKPPRTHPKLSTSTGIGGVNKSSRRPCGCCTDAHLDILNHFLRVSRRSPSEWLECCPTDTLISMRFERRHLRTSRYRWFKQQVDRIERVGKEEEEVVVGGGGDGDGGGGGGSS